jgi:hypothetical protein
MIPLILLGAALSLAGLGGGASPAAAATPGSTGCLSSGDGYFKAHLAGAVDAEVDWHDADTGCAGESRDVEPRGVRLSFEPKSPVQPKLLFVIGITGVREGEALRDAAANVTVFVQGTSRVYSTRGDARCTVDALRQRRLEGPHVFRLEVRGFCTQPAHAVRGSGEVLVSRFDFAGRVDYGATAESAP